METRFRFVIKFARLIVVVLSYFDRLIRKIYLPITNRTCLKGFIDCVLKIQRMDFMAFAEEQSNPFVDYAEHLVQKVGAECRFLQAFKRKDKLVDETLRQRPIINGLICIFCCTETCSSFKLIYGKGCPSHVSGGRPRACALFLLPRSHLWADLHQPDQMVPVHRPDLCQRPLLWKTRCSNRAWDSPCVTMPSRL